jgi:hypothetical protein
MNRRLADEVQSAGEGFDDNRIQALCLFLGAAAQCPVYGRGNGTDGVLPVRHAGTLWNLCLQGNPASEPV